MDNTKQINRVSNYQMILLITIYGLMTGFTYLPAINIPPANQDIWIVYLLSIPYTILYCFPLLYLSNKFNNLNLFQYGKIIMGKFFGMIVSIYYFSFLFISLIIFVGVFIEILDAALFPETPTLVTAGIILITCVLLSYQGFRNIARLGEVIIPIILVIIFLLIILGYRNYDIDELLPILGDSTFKEINLAAMNVGIRFLDVILLTMITPYLSKKEDLNKIFFRSLLYSTILNTLIVVVIQMGLGVEFAKHLAFPFYTFTRLINLGEIIQGFDSLYIISWIMGNALMISGYLYFATVALGEITNRKNSYFIIPISIIVLILVTLIKDNLPILPLEEPTSTIILVMSIFSVLVIPITMLIVYLLRKNKI